MRIRKAKKEAEFPKNDPRVKLLAKKIKKENCQPGSLIEILHTAQNAFGYLPLNVLQYITKELKLPPARVFSTATFYHFFSLKSKGEHTCLICTGTACYVKGAQVIVNELEKQFGLQPGQVTTDNKLGVAVARCIGACGIAPAVILDDEVLAKVEPQELTQKIKSKLAAS